MDGLRKLLIKLNNKDYYNNKCNVQNLYIKNFISYLIRLPFTPVIF